jgi:hypothetical protein
MSTRVSRWQDVVALEQHADDVAERRVKVGRWIQVLSPLVVGAKESARSGTWQALCLSDPHD